MTRKRESRGPWTPMLLVFGIVLLAVLGRRLGAEERVAAAVLATGSMAVLVLHAARSVRRGGGSRFLTVTFAAAIAIASAIPAIRSILPGDPILSTVLEREGSSVVLPPASAGPVRLLVSSELPEDRRAYVGFTLALGTELVEGSLEHGVKRWGTGEEFRRYHVERSAVYLDARIAPEVGTLSVERLSSATPSPLHVDVYRRLFPSWILVLLALVALSFAGLVEGLTGTRRQVAPAVGAALAAGLLAGWSATPDQALWPVIVSLVSGAFVGVPAGFATSSAARWLRVALKS